MPIAPCLVLSCLLLSGAGGLGEATRPVPQQPLPRQQKTQAARDSLKLTPTQRAAAAKLEKAASKAQQQALARMAKILEARLRKAHKRGRTMKFNASLRRQLTPHMRAVKTYDAVAVSTAILQRTAGRIEGEVHDLAARLAQTNAAKATIREEMSMLQDELSDWPDDGSTRTITYREVVVGETIEVVEHTKTMTKEEAEALLESYENLLQTLADRSQMDMQQLQNAMNQQAQLMQMMSNLQKMMHDTVMALIRNMK